jgi:3,4-dihydroxy-9,10-secoandrosta-1,3,5(10)-triene-9,17-dione 4,5-dioxygenase
MMAAVRALGYLRLGVKEPNAWTAFAARVLGLQSAAPGGDRAQRYRMDARSYRLETVPAAADGIVGVGLELADAGALSVLARRLEEAGVAVETAAEATLAERSVRGLLRCSDPSGTPLELFWGQRVEVSPFVSTRGVRFITGELGLGHVVLGVQRECYRETVTFYRDLLGFKPSDLFRIGDREVTFLHCNPRHHSLAIGETPSPAGLIHFMLEVDDFDAVGFALDACYAEGVRVKRDLGRHSNDRMISFYAETPSGFDVEYGWGGRLIDDSTWTVTEISHGTLWGHRPKRSDAKS